MHETDDDVISEMLEQSELMAENLDMFIRYLDTTSRNSDDPIYTDALKIMEV